MMGDTGPSSKKCVQCRATFVRKAKEDQVKWARRKYCGILCLDVARRARSRGRQALGGTSGPR